MAESKIRIALRFDDPSPTSDVELEQAIIAALNANRCAATIAVIPLKPVNGSVIRLTEERAHHLIEAAARSGMEIALHGCSHERRNPTHNDRPSEFEGLALSEQVDLIERGLDALRAVFAGNIAGFVPPWNRFDAATMRALEQFPFRYVSAGWEGPRYVGQLAILPGTCNLSHLRTAVAEARAFRALMPIVIAVLHHYDFAESGSNKSFIGLAGFRELLDWLGDQPDLTIMPLSEVATSVCHQDWRRGIERHRRIQALHWRLQVHMPRYCILTAPLWRLALGESVRLHGRWVRESR